VICNRKKSSISDHHNKFNRLDFPVFFCGSSGRFNNRKMSGTITYRGEEELHH
jgi:hypothetical protein